MLLYNHSKGITDRPKAGKENIMNSYMVIVRIGGNSYMTKVKAESLCSAEHQILDMGICGRHEYGVDDAQAFGAEEMKTGCFIQMALTSETISMDELETIISERNARIKAQDRIREIEKQMKKLAEELEAAKRVLAA